MLVVYTEVNETIEILPIYQLWEKSGSMNTWYRNTEDTEKEYHKGSILSAEHAPYTYYVLDKDEISQYLPSDNISTDITTVYIMTTYILD